MGRRCANTPTRDQSTCDELMETFYRGSAPMEAPARALDLMRRKPQRVSITLNWSLHQRLMERCDFEGRSLSDLAAHLLEMACPK